MKTRTNHLRPEIAFRALSDPTRLRILSLLREGELCVCDLVNILDLPQPTVSRHLAYLRKTGLVSARKDGLWQHYSLMPGRSTFHAALLKCVEASPTVFPDLRNDLRTLKSGGRSDCCE